MSAPGLAELEEAPHPALARLRERAPVAWVDALGGWLVLTRNLAEAVMRDAASFTVDDPRFSTGRVVGSSMLSTDGAEHDAHRAPWVAPFRPGVVRDRLAGAVRAEADALLGALAPRGHGDLRSELAGPLAAETMRHALGLEDTRPGRLREWYRAIVASVTAVTAGEEPTPEGAAAVAGLRAALPGGTSAPDAAVVLFGGIETTEGMIANMLWHLLSERACFARVAADRNLVSVAVEESLRLEPAASVVDRYATRDVVLGGAEIRAGDLVRVSLAAANRDPAHVTEPDAFDLDRPATERRHLTFARGPHVCLGAHLARLEGRVALEAVLDWLPGLRLAEPTTPRGLVFRKPDALRVAWDV